MLILASIFWETRDFVPSFAATQVTASAVVATTAEANDARVLRAFKHARAATPADVQFEVEPDPSKPVRNSTVTVRAASEDQALADLEAITEGMKKAFADEGPGEFLVNASKHATPVPNQTMTTLSLAFRVAALLLLLGGLATIFLGWRSSGLPKQVLWAILLGIGIPALYLVPEGAWSAWAPVVLIVMPIPIIIAILVIRKTAEVRKAATWTTGKARITDSKLASKRHRFAGDTTKVTNTAEVAYEFTVGGETYKGKRISIGDNPADGVEVVVRRYAKGSTVPVYYNPANPAECVLEREAPASLGCIWGGAAFLLLIGAIISVAIVKGGSINAMLTAAFPQVQHPLMALCISLMGLFCILVYLVGRRQAAIAAKWPTTKGLIVSSQVESFISQPSSDGISTKTTLYQPVIEYSYRVAGLEYHSNQIQMGVITASGNPELAQKCVALYPVDKEVRVQYDPQNPGNAVLESGFGKGWGLLLIAAALFGVAWYVATHS